MSKLTHTAFISSLSLASILSAGLSSATPVQEAKTLQLPMTSSLYAKKHKEMLRDAAYGAFLIPTLNALSVINPVSKAKIDPELKPKEKGENLPPQTMKSAFSKSFYFDFAKGSAIFALASKFSTRLANRIWSIIEPDSFKAHQNIPTFETLEKKVTISPIPKSLQTVLQPHLEEAFKSLQKSLDKDSDLKSAKKVINTAVKAFSGKHQQLEKAQAEQVVDEMSQQFSSHWTENYTKIATAISQQGELNGIFSTAAEEAGSADTILKELGHRLGRPVIRIPVHRVNNIQDFYGKKGSSLETSETGMLLDLLKEQGKGVTNPIFVVENASTALGGPRKAECEILLSELITNNREDGIWFPYLNYRHFFRGVSVVLVSGSF